jgi:hypothetical protein
MTMTRQAAATPRRQRCEPTSPADDGPKSAAQRKREQRQRDWRHLTTSGVSIDEASTSALVESINRLIADAMPGILGAVLTELGRRGGVAVTTRPYALKPGKRVKS